MGNKKFKPHPRWAGAKGAKNFPPSRAGAKNAKKIKYYKKG